MSDGLKAALLVTLIGMSCFFAVAALEAGSRMSHHMEIEIRDSMIEKYKTNPVVTILPGDPMERRGFGGTW